ncbi:MAG TPA: NAD(+) synthase [Thermoguttaceae bacterium]|nr:NAD(+) synthase [Thermoguttaceae bacterium]
MTMHNTLAGFDLDALVLDAEAATDQITHAVRHQVLERLRRKGAVVGLSGGIDSSTAAALCVRAFGPDRVLGVMMPERDSAGDTLELSRMVAESLGIETVLEDITETLDAVGCYRRRDEALQSVFPEYGPGWRFKIVLPDVLDGSPYRVSSVVAQSPDGQTFRRRLPLAAYQTIVAATNFKQRTRKMLEYYHADRLHYAVVGTPNRLEYDQGFFVKNGDGSADFKPIAHLYKTQVYQLAEHLGVPEAIRRRPPTTDTYSLPQSQEEFYFSLSYDKLDACLFGKNHGVEPALVAAATGLTEKQVEWVYRDIDAKRRVAEYLHAGPMLVE